MAGKDIVQMSQRELRRLHIIHNAIEGLLKQKEAAELLSLSDRQIRRLIKKVEEEGDAGIIHKSRGKPSNSRLPKKIKAKVIELYRQKYEGFGPLLASEKLLERDGVTVNDETLRKWLIESGDWKKTRKGRKHRQWRPRKHHFGEMIQIDGSHHDWFEGRGPECVLMGYIDDATGKAFARFYDYEGTMPAFDSFKRYARKYGIPQKAYLDKHTTYKSPKKAAFTGYDEEPLSQFERAMKELGVEVSHAHSPQAKGRVERLFRTFQDRLVKEMRLRGIKTVEEANKFLAEYLPGHNRKFAVKPKEEANLHRKIPKGLNLDSILCIKEERVLRNDFTISYKGKLYQITESIKAEKVTVQERINGKMLITYNGASVEFKEITERPEKQKKPRIIKKKATICLPAEHPWRKFNINGWKKKKWAWAA
ncbi:MAG: ISNCY family transposase [Thermodesulfovibrionales bacterium]|nr:ISNCY family transposase [Nitrospinota bacterium]MCG2709213.1 ISNCY family transposase [Thermodesulfovibrionales bacterium]